MKKRIQKLIRLINIFAFKKKLPSQIVVYFHDIDSKELSSIEDIILFFKNLEYKFVSVSQISKNIGTENKMFTFTFDDGFKNWTYVLPIFKKYNIEATFFLNSIFLTNENKNEFLKNIALEDEAKLISKDGINKLVSNNHEIGAHTHSHFKLSNLTLDSLEKEIETNLKYLNNFYKNVVSFAIPYGMSRYLNKNQLDYLHQKFETICFGEAGMLFNQNSRNIQRYPWQVNLSFYQNLINLSTDTYIFNTLTKRSGLG